MNVEQHGTGRRGRIGDMNAAPGHLPNEPGVHGSRQQPTALCQFLRAFHIPEEPLELCRAKIRIHDQSGLIQDHLLMLLLQLIRCLRGTPVLPDHGIIDRNACLTVPKDHRLAFMVNPNASDGILRAKLGDRLLNRFTGALPNFFRVMLHPARAGIDLTDFFISTGSGIPILIQQKGRDPGSALV